MKHVRSDAWWGRLAFNALAPFSSGSENGLSLPRLGQCQPERQRPSLAAWPVSVSGSSLALPPGPGRRAAAAAGSHRRGRNVASVRVGEIPANGGSSGPVTELASLDRQLRSRVVTESLILGTVERPAGVRGTDRRRAGHWTPAVTLAAWPGSGSFQVPESGPSPSHGDGSNWSRSIGPGRPGSAGPGWEAPGLSAAGPPADPALRLDHDRRAG